jgi:hypothetical protein
MEDTHPTAAFLAAEMKKCTSSDQQILAADGSMKPAREIFGKIAYEYANNFNEIELREIIKPGNVNLDTSAVHGRMRRIRMMLSQLIYKSSNYACVTLGLSDFNFAYIYILLLDEPKVAYVSIGDSLKSYDGEWRDLMMTVDSLNYVLREYGVEIDSLENDISIGVDPKINIYFNVPLKESTIGTIRDHISRDGLTRKLAAISWLVARSRDSRSPGFNKFADLLGKKKIKMTPRLDDLLKIIGSIFDTRISQLDTPVDARATRIGQKLIHITPDEASHPLNNLYQAWNEILVSQQTLDLIINMVAPGFAAHSFWIMIYNTSKFIFNDKSIRTRIVQSQTIRLTPNDKRTDKILSDSTICSVNEYCGPTWKSYIISDTPDVISYGEKYIFELIYGIYCLHARLNQFHGDFHCENATIKKDLVTGDRYVGYIIGDSAYCFPDFGRSGYVIDFSRSIEMDNPRWVERIIEKYEMYFKWPTSDTKAAFDENVYAALDNPAVLARLKRIASAFDIWEFTNTTIVQVGDIIGVDTRVGALLKKINSQCMEILKLVLEPDGNQDLEWSANIILTSNFEARPIKKMTERFSGIYRFENELKYSARSLDKLPKSFSAGPITRDGNDVSVDMFMFPAGLIRARYKMFEENMKELMSVN